VSFLGTGTMVPEIGVDLPVRDPRSAGL